MQVVEQEIHYVSLVNWQPDVSAAKHNLWLSESPCNYAVFICFSFSLDYNLARALYLQNSINSVLCGKPQQTLNKLRYIGKQVELLLWVFVAEC